MCPIVSTLDNSVPLRTELMEPLIGREIAWILSVSILCGNMYQMVCVGAEIVALHMQRVELETSRDPLIFFSFVEKGNSLRNIAKPLTATPEINIYIYMLKAGRLLCVWESERKSAVLTLLNINHQTSKDNVLIFFATGGHRWAEGGGRPPRCREILWRGRGWLRGGESLSLFEDTVLHAVVWLWRNRDAACWKQIIRYTTTEIVQS